MKAETSFGLPLSDQNLEQNLALSKFSVNICLLQGSRLGTKEMMKGKGK
jgi:hypothetical protein